MILTVCGVGRIIGARLTGAKVGLGITTSGSLTVASVTVTVESSVQSPVHDSAAFVCKSVVNDPSVIESSRDSCMSVEVVVV